MLADDVDRPRAVALRQEVDTMSASTGLMTRRHATKLATTLTLSAMAGRALTGVEHAHAQSTPTSATPSISGAQATLVWTYKGEGENVLGGPATVVFAPDGTLWVVNDSDKRIHILSRDGEFLSSWSAKGEANGYFNFANTGEVAFAQDGDFYVADAGNARVQHFTKDHVYLSNWSGAPTPNKTFGQLIGVSVDPDGNVWAVDNAAISTSKFTPEGTYLLTVGGYSQEPGRCSNIGTVAFDPDGHLLVPDGRGDIQIFDLDGTFIRMISLVNAAGESITSGYDVSIDPAGNLYVPDPESKSLYVYDPEGRLLLTWTGKDETQLYAPWCVIADGDGNMYVVDHGRSTLYKIHIDF
jgi:DNA-binding beta-propeller fold protein YncE